jgi:hypothetical protein
MCKVVHRRICKYNQNAVFLIMQVQSVSTGQQLLLTVTAHIAIMNYAIKCKCYRMDCYLHRVMFDNQLHVLGIVAALE